MNLGLFVMENLENLALPEVKLLVKDVAKLFLGSTTGVSRFVFEKNVANKSNKELTSVVPQKLLVFPHSEFCCIIHTQQERLLISGWSLPAIDEMDQGHQDLVQAVTTEPDLHDVIAACNEDVSFDDCWSIVKGRFEFLCCFVGRIASVFPGTAQVENVFSIVKAKKYKFRNALTNISLKGVI